MLCVRIPFKYTFFFLLCKKFKVSIFVLGLILAQQEGRQGVNRKQQSHDRREAAKEAAKRPTQKPQAAAADDDDETTDQCPEPNGYFADAEQCDK